MASLFSPRITRLNDALSNQIAAGEVVERPGSALKELIENSLDAGASAIRVHIQEGGVKLLEVSDDGHGIHPDDLVLALDRHATSKIKEAEDLFSIRTWGFRGEALASIAAVSRLDLLSRHTNFPTAKEILCEATAIQSTKENTRTIGTTVRVEELFFNTPARRKFLKSQAAETSHCVQTMHRLALASPEVSFELWIDNQKSFHFSSAKNPETRITQVFREAFHLKLEESELLPFEKQKPDASIRGYMLPMKHCIPSARGIFIFVNGRSVRDKLLQQAVMTAAKEVLFGNSFPQLVLYLETSPENVDVNVHPTKSEVRFRNPSQIFGLIRSTVEEALSKNRPLPSFGSLENSAPEPSTQAFPMEMATQWNQKPGLQLESTRPIASVPIASNPVASQPTRKGPQFLGTLKNTYLVCQTDEGLLLVDQHAAHERITYEKLRANFKNTSAALLIPILVEIPARSLDLLENELPKLAELGLILDRTGPGQISVREIPSLLLRSDGSPRVALGKLLRELCAALEQEQHESIVQELVKKVMLDALASESCHGSVRAGQSLSAVEALALLSQMQETDFAGHCPHGRPTTVHLAWTEIERMFKRIQ